MLLAAATSALPLTRGPLVVFDSGGGSSQFTFGQASRVDERFSVDVGAVRFAERFGLAGAVEREAVDAALEAIAADLTSLDGRDRPAAVIGMGGTVTNLTAVKHGLLEYDPDAIPWRDELLTPRLEIVDGQLVVPTGPGWGVDIDESVARLHLASD